MLDSSTQILQHNNEQISPPEPKKKVSAWRHTELEVLRALKKLRVADSRAIAKELNLHHKWVGQKLTMLKKAGRLYVADYRKTALQGPPRELYAIKLSEEDVDAARPKPKTGTQKTTEYRKRKQMIQQLGVFKHDTNA